MKRLTVFLAALAGFAFGAISLIVSSGPSAAQQASETLRLNLFEGADSVAILPNRLPTLAGAARNARPSRGECPRGTITTWAPKGDELFQQALAGGRSVNVRAALAQMGVDISQFYFNYKVADTDTIAHDTVLTFGAPRDETPPKLHTSSTPPKGSKVTPRQQIVVTMTARDDATRWESGIRTIELFADSEGGRRVAAQPYPPHLPTCEGQQPPFTFAATYEVPPDPPPVVRLRAVTKDFAGHEDKDVAEFPTADFYGTFTATSFSAVQDRFRTRADVVLNHDSRGNLTGTMVGQQEYVAHSTSNCSFRQVQPNRFRVSLVGSFTERSSPAEGPSLKVFIGEIEETALTAEARCQGTAGGPIGPPGGWKFKMGVWTPEAFLGTPSPFGEGEVLPDGTREYKVAHEAGGGGTRWTLTLRRARN